MAMTLFYNPCLNDLQILDESSDKMQNLKAVCNLYQLTIWSMMTLVVSKDVLVVMSLMDFVYVTTNLPFKDQIKRLYFN